MVSVRAALQATGCRLWVIGCPAEWVAGTAAVSQTAVDLLHRAMAMDVGPRTAATPVTIALQQEDVEIARLLEANRDAAN